MKILHVSPRYFPYIGGLEEHVRNICERLASRYEVTVFTTDPSGKLPKHEEINGVNVKRFKTWAPNEAYYFSKDIKEALGKHSNSFDIVHAHSYHAIPAYYAAQTKSKNKLFFTPHYHGKGHTFFRSLLHLPYRFFGKKIFEKSDMIICVSSYEKGLIEKRFKISEDKIAVIPNGVNKEEFKNLKKIEKDYKTILCVGRVEKYKGMQYLVQVMPKLNENIVLEIIGQGPYKKNLISLAKKLKVRNRVKFYQNLPRSQLLRKYAEADIFVLPSKYEAYGISVAEAMCAGTPCIVANTSALSEWIDNKNCFGIDYPIDLDELADLILSVIGRKVSSVKVLDWNDVVDKLANVYENL